MSFMETGPMLFDALQLSVNLVRQRITFLANMCREVLKLLRLDQSLSKLLRDLSKVRVLV